MNLNTREPDHPVMTDVRTYFITAKFADGATDSSVVTTRNLIGYDRAREIAQLMNERPITDLTVTAIVRPERNAE